MEEATVSPINSMLLIESQLKCCTASLVLHSTSVVNISQYIITWFRKPAAGFLHILDCLLVVLQHRTRWVTCCFSVISTVFPRYSDFFRFSLHSLIEQLTAGHERPSNSSLWEKIKQKYCVMSCIKVYLMTAGISSISI